MLSWEKRTSVWLNKRIPRARQFNLDLRSIFIFPSRFGCLFLVLCAALFVLGTNYQNNLMRILCYFLLALFLLHLFMSYINFSRLQVQLGKLHSVYAQDTLAVPLWLNAVDHKQAQPEGLLLAGFWRQQNGISIDLDELTNPACLSYYCPTRGRYPLPRITLSSYYPLGLFRCWTHLAFDQDLIVYPTPLPCQLNKINAEDSNQEGEHLLSRSGHDDFNSLKQYQPGEPLNHVAWKQVAKGQGMLTKLFDHNVSQGVTLRLSSEPGLSLETKLSHLCYQVIQLANRGREFALQLGSTYIENGKGSEHQTACLEALALYQQVISNDA